MNLTNLPEPVFLSTDAEEIKRQTIARWEALAGKTLQPAQADRLFIDVMAYREKLVSVSINEAAKQNLLNYARAPMIDYIGDLIGVYRLNAFPATTTLKFTLDTARQTDTVIPQGTQVSNAPSQGVIFVTDSEITITAGDTSDSVTASAQTAGTSANTISANALRFIVDAIGLSGVSVTNADIEAGADAETDDQLRERIRLAPESFSTAGSRLAYKFHAQSANPSIIDAAPTREEGGIINIFVLTKTGAASQSVIDDVTNACSGEKVRPLSDSVRVFSGQQNDFVLDVTAVLLPSANRQAIQQHLQTEADSYTQAKRQKLGQDIERSQIIDALFTEGMYSLTINSPAQNIIIDESEWANCTAINIQFGEVNNG